MAKEIELKYLIDNISDLISVLPTAVEEIDICQGYLCGNPEVRIRTCITLRPNKEASSTITIKSKANKSNERDEFEYNIPFTDGSAMILMCENAILNKRRYKMPDGWEIDIYQGKLTGLIVAEIELKSADEKIELPYWIGEDVSSNPEYKNSTLVRRHIKLIDKYVGM